MLMVGYLFRCTCAPSFRILITLDGMLRWNSVCGEGTTICAFYTGVGDICTSVCMYVRVTVHTFKHIYLLTLVHCTKASYWYIIFMRFVSFILLVFLQILWIMALGILLWHPVNLGCSIVTLAWDPWDLWSQLFVASWNPGDPESCFYLRWDPGNPAS